MAVLRTASFEVLRLSCRSMPRNASRGILMPRRGVSGQAFQSSSKALAAQNFAMPAMSPTMTEGNIASWKVKEGDTFTTGDVLLEIETDKAQMDVEAQEDGKVAKITAEDGAKGVKVGTRIAILAEPDDDLSSLSLPPEEPVGQPKTEEKSPKQEPEASKEAKSQAPPPKSSESKSSSSSAKPQKQTYPLYPSIVQLLHQNGLSLSEADRIPASGPKGRLLKGDVLAYLGQISKDYSSQQSARISKLGHLDLSNVKPAPPKAESEAKSLPKNAATQKSVEPEVADTEVAVPISLSSVLAVQKRVQETLGVSLPLSTFLTRATELANEDLPRSSTSKPTTDELFNDVLGLNNINSSVSRGAYIPQITALPPPSFKTANAPLTAGGGKKKTDDIYDILTAGSSSSSSVPKQSIPELGRGIMAGSKPGEATNLFSVSVPKGEEKRARTFLERVKTILQVEPGRLIL